MGGAVESMGPEIVLGAVPLNITGYECVTFVPAIVKIHFILLFLLGVI